jgi:hypothetical protein
MKCCEYGPRRARKLAETMALATVASVFDCDDEVKFASVNGPSILLVGVQYNGTSSSLGIDPYPGGGTIGMLAYAQGPMIYNFLWP